ncbi:hypothetical protein ACI48D_22565 [Massilia sp. LXY-6]|uniref:hypothetical protein n=1 Tax=Massilia sp. LXY-6 TaxID=3379823 RepID=UPI003EE373F9
MTTNKYAITTSNFKKLVQKTKVEIEEDIITTFKSIYSETNLRPYLNQKEATDIRKLSEFLTNTEKYGSALQKQLEKSALPAVNKAVSNHYLFTSASSAPSYHKSIDCKTLTNDFENFEIPLEIRNKGDDEVNRFRNFAKENRGLLKNGKEYLFIQKLKDEFRLKCDINKISFHNSGKVEVSKMSTPNIKENIAQIVERLEELRVTDDGKLSIAKYMFAPSTAARALRENETLNDTDREILEHKKNLLDLIIEFNIQKSDGLNFSETLLQFYGFKKCGICFSDEVRFEL